MRGFQKISREKLSEARDVFAALLRRKTKESDWQRFFTEHPYVLSTTLPLALRPDHVIPMARPGKPDPDFVLYPWDTSPVPFYGIVELKRPDSQIVTVRRSNVALLTTDAETAIAQSREYANTVGYKLRHAERNLLCLGNQAYIFVIMGLSDEISQKLGEKLYREQIDGKLPRNVQLLPYDTVFSRFDARIPPQVLLMVPKLPIPREKVEQLLQDLDEEERGSWEAGRCA